MWHHFLLVCVLFSSTIGQQSFLNYVLLVPALIEHPSTENLCVDIRGARETLNLTVTLHHGTHDDTLLKQEVNPPNLFKCVQFKSPNLKERKEEVIPIHISIVGQNTLLSERKNLLVRNMGSFALIQTDKPVYKPGETVKIQLLIFDRDLLPVDDTVSLVEIQDSKNNRIGQWLNLIPEKGIIDVSFPLDSESQRGVYTINVPNAKQDFHVLANELPKFEVRVKLPTVVTVLTKTIHLQICASFFFGKPVQGNIKASLCRKALCHEWIRMTDQCPQDVCMEYEGRTDRRGCYEEEVQTEPYQLNSYKYLMAFDAEASFKEDGTGTQTSATSSSKISAMIAKVTFEDTESADSYYKPGLRYKGKLKLTHADGSAMKYQTLYMTEEYDSVIKQHVYKTDEKGEVCFTLDSTPWNGHTVFLIASYQKEKPERVYGKINPYYTDAHKTLNLFNSAINSFIKVQPLDHDLTCDQEIPIEIDYLLRGSEIITQEDSLDLRYMVVARGKLVTHGVRKIHINRNSVMMGTMEVLLPVTANFAPLAHILAYILPGNEQIVADTEMFKVSKCFNNKVTLAFADKEITPDSQTTLHLNAQPGSLCSVKSVDESVLYLRPESDISTDTVYSLLLQRRRYNYPYRVHEDNPLCMPMLSAAYSWAPDVFKLIQSIGMKVLTNTHMKKPSPCSHYPPVAALSHDGAPYNEPNLNIPDFIPVDEADMPLIQPSISASEMKKRIRMRFPETLISKLVKVGVSGQADIKVHVPDSITGYKATAFCMGDTGLGIANATTMKAFQPFFLHITHPYSVVREESCVIKISLFNYLSKAMMVKVDFHAPPELKVTECPTCTNPQCLYPEESKVLTWEAQALKVGSAEIVVSAQAIHTEEKCGGEQPIIPDTGASDTVMKTMKIKAEGMPVEKSHNSVLCGKGNLMSETIFITIPPNAVPNSVTASFSVAGDLMGSALQGIEKLVSLPCGCGEQTMARFLLNIHVLNYLDSTNQMTEDIKQQIIKYLLQGYQRLLEFRRKDGSFRTFANSDEDGNVWLTASVMKSLNAASCCISVDKKYIEEAGKWLKENQLPSGCFRNRGKLFRSSVQGGLDDDTALTAYVTIAFQDIIASEDIFSAQDSTVSDALNCLRNSIPQVQSLYTKALLAHTFTLAGEHDTREMLLHELHDKAVNKGGEIYWPANPHKLHENSAWSQPNSNEVEVASYVILAHLSSDTVSANDINKASCIAKWMAHRRNPNGGFDNTQDTLVGFQALALFSKITYTKHEALKISLSSDKEDSVHHFNVDEETRLLLQRKTLTNIPGNYIVKVEGEGCVFTQTSLKYNILQTEDRLAFEIKANVTLVEGQAKPLLGYAISVRYTGPRNASNMALVQVELPSGFSANKESLDKTIKGLVKRTETEESLVNFYISSLDGTFETINFLAVEEFAVQNQKPKMIKVNDYYDTGVEAFTMYDVPHY